MAEIIEIEGGHSLNGEINISGAKNSVLPLLVSSILADNENTTFDDVPDIKDVYHIMEILRKLGANVLLGKKGDVDQIVVDPTNKKNIDLTFSEISKLRASYYFMGAMLAQYHQVKILLPGGCFLGPRPIDLHLKGFTILGATIKSERTPEGEIIEISAPSGLKGNEIFLDFASVGATINLILASVKADGITTIENAAKEPEVIDVVTYLNNMGAKIHGAGTNIIRIEGVKKLSGCYHQVIPDRIEAGTYIMFAAATRGEVKIKNIIPEHIEHLLLKLKEIGVEFEQGEDYIIIKDRQKLKAAKVRTGIYPSFATDLQQVFATVCTQATGKSIIDETIYRERFKNCEELNKMGANIAIDYESGRAVLQGPTTLKGAAVEATDLRAGASLILAGLIAEGKTEIYNVKHIKRGYQNIDQKLSKLGAKIKFKNI